MLDVSRRFNGEPLAINDVKEHRNLLWLLATSGYGGGGLLDISCDVAMKLMEDGDIDHLFDREDDAEIPSRNELQHAIHQNANLATQILSSKRLLWTSLRIVAKLTQIHC